MTKNNRKALPNLIAKYSICYLIFAFFCVILFFIVDKKALFDINDGLKQQYNGFIYSGILLRKFLKNIFVDHVYEIPMWDSTIGMGSDQYILLNPLASPLTCLFSALVPNKYCEYAFNFLVILRLFTAGLTYLLFAYKKGYKNLNAIAGAMVYVFSSTTLVIISQIGFSVTFVLFPLLLLSADILWEKDKSILYVVILSYCVIMSFYFTYMMLILLFIYCVIKFIFEEKKSIKRFFSLFIRFFILSVISFCIGSAVILPGMLGLTSLSRLTTRYELSLLNIETLRRFFAYGFVSIQADGDSLIGVSSFVFVSAVCLLISKKKAPVLKWCLSLCFLSFAFPIVGSVFNGFNYSSYRYIFSLIFCIAYLVTVSFDSVNQFKGKIWYISLGASALYAVICFLFIDGYSGLSGVSLFITVLLVGLINTFERYFEQIREKAFLVVIFISCVIIGYSCIHIELNHGLLDSGTAYERVFLDGGNTLRQTVNDPNYRTDSINADFTTTIVNASMATELNGFDFYQSNQNQYVEFYYTDLGVISHPLGFSRNGFRGRCYLEILNTCNYIARSDENVTCIKPPYTYEYVKTEGDYSLYKSGRGVSLVYFYDDVISTKTYMNMDPVLRETNLMYSMVLDKPGQPESDVVSDVISVPFEIEASDKAVIDGSKITILEDNVCIMLKPERIEAGQISVCLLGLRSSDVEDWYYRNTIILLDADNNPIAMDTSAQCKTTDTYYYGNDDVVFSFESIDDEINTIGLIFFSKGEYNLDSIRIYSRPYELMNKTLDAFYDHADMEDITYEYHGNHLSITASADTDRYLYIAIPFSKGWHAKVDGTPAQIIRANTAFMAIPLSAGSHSIEMTYVTPYLYLGWIISAAGIVLYFGYLFFEKKKRITS
ncbi:Uncharacterized membrane protein YfhO [Ruminococcaceae bacterium YAD3003]|nr:Uncharacterized membrane protein YfhO [Ruminococcaceae bacterium YAD3003]